MCINKENSKGRGYSPSALLRANLTRVTSHLISTLRQFPSSLLLSLLLYFLFIFSLPPIHPTRFSFCSFPGFLATFILLSPNNNNHSATSCAECWCGWAVMAQVVARLPYFVPGFIYFCIWMYSSSTAHMSFRHAKIWLWKTRYF